MTPEVAIRVLTSQGYTVGLTDTPGLFGVEGRGELTSAQLVQLALEQIKGPVTHGAAIPKEPYTDASDAEIKARITSLVAELNGELDKAAEAGIEAEVSDFPFQQLGRRTSRKISIKLNRPL